jgi:hypothetical protein
MNDQERAARYSDLFDPAGHEHPSNCAYCPICATIGVLRNTRPEVLDHLAAAARELVLAAGLLVEEAERVVGSTETEPTSSSGKSRVRRIDVS